MKIGDKIVCRGPRGYNFTTGKVYTVLEYEPPFPSDYFTWPAYVHVEDDSGKHVVCHANRFELISGENKS